MQSNLSLHFIRMTMSLFFITLSMCSL
jgi:hypothetical protein